MSFQLSRFCSQTPPRLPEERRRGCSEAQKVVLLMLYDLQSNNFFQFCFTEVYRCFRFRWIYSSYMFRKCEDQYLHQDFFMYNVLQHKWLEVHWKYIKFVLNLTSYRWVLRLFELFRVYANLVFEETEYLAQTARCWPYHLRMGFLQASLRTSRKWYVGKTGIVPPILTFNLRKPSLYCISLYLSTQTSSLPNFPIL